MLRRIEFRKQAIDTQQALPGQDDLLAIVPEESRRLEVCEGAREMPLNIDVELAAQEITIDAPEFELEDELARQPLALIQCQTDKKSLFGRRGPSRSGSCRSS